MASASNSTSLYAPSYPSSYPYTFSVSFNETSTSTANNTSTISCSASFKNSGLYWSTGENKTLSVYWYDDNQNSNGTLVGSVAFKSMAQGGETKTASGTITVTHKTNGTLNGYAQARWDKTGSFNLIPNDATLNTANTALTTIPRYANITSYSVSKRSATSFTVSWGADATCDAVQYRYKTSSSSSYGSWTNASGTSFNIGSLSANTTYNVQIRVRRQDSQLWTESSVATQTTNKLPTQSLNNKTETTIKMNWSSDVTASYIWYSTNNGSSWTQVTSNANATSGSYNITGLSANTTYNVKTRVRRSSNSVDEDTSALAVTTYKIPTQSLKSKTETSITMNWSADSTISKVEYSINNGSSYTQATANANATSGSYTISGLTANTAYNIKTRVTRSATSTNYGVSAVLAVTTYQYPYVSAVGTANLTIGNSQTLTLYNPLSRSCTVYMKQTNTSGTTLYSGTSSSTSITFTPTASTLYNSIPSATTGNAVYYCVYSSQNVGTKSGTYTIDNSGGTLNPTFADTNWSYTADLTNLTNDDQVVIKNQSTVTYTIDTAPTFKYNATLKNYKLEWGTKSSTTTTTSGTVQKGDSATLKVSAIDSRNYYTETLKALGNKYVEYFNPTMTKGETHRDSGVETDTTLTMEGSIFNQNFGANGVLNEFISAKYYVSTDNSTWSNAFDIPVSNVTYNNNNYKIENYNIHANGSSGGFVVGTRYYIKVDLTDKINTYTFTGITITDGKLATDTYQDNNGEYHRGVNGLADENFALKVYGDATTTGQIRINRISSWISDRDKAIVRNDTPSGTGSYNPVISSKTENGNWTIGQYNGDDLYFNYTTDTDYNSNNNVSTKYYLNPNTGLFNITSRYIYHILTNPSSSTTYYLPFIDGIGNGTKYSIRGNNGISYNTAEGTASAAGSSQLMLGNGTASGTAGNKRGYLRLYDLTAYRVIMQTNGSYTNNRSMTFPNQSGTIQIRPTNLYNNTTGTSGTITLSASAANFTYLDIYFYITISDSAYNYSFVRVYSPNNKRIELRSSWKNQQSIQTAYKYILISATSLSVTAYGNNTITTTKNLVGTSNDINITRVDGWV